MEPVVSSLREPEERRWHRCVSHYRALAYGARHEGELVPHRAAAAPRLADFCVRAPSALCSGGLNRHVSAPLALASANAAPAVQAIAPAEHGRRVVRNAARTRR